MISALFTIFNPDDTVPEHVRAVSRQADRVFLCDNSPRRNESMFLDIPNAVYIYNHGNLGLSKAFNIVLKDRSFDWRDDDYIVFFDQDSVIKEGHIEILIRKYEHLKKMGYKIGGIEPVYYDRNTKKVVIPRAKKQITKEDLIVSTMITSSFLCRYRSLRIVDFWNEAVFLDMADWDLCWRMMQKGMVCVKTKAVILDHAIGAGRKKAGTVKLEKTAPEREHYLDRASLYLLTRRYVPVKYRLVMLRNLMEHRE